MTHAAIALVAQVLVGALSGRWLIGGLVASGFFLGREHAQAEYRWIESFGAGVRANLPVLGGFDPVAWTAKSVADTLLPVIAVGICYLAVTRIRRRGGPAA